MAFQRLHCLLLRRKSRGEPTPKLAERLKGAGFGCAEVVLEGAPKPELLSSYFDAQLTAVLFCDPEAGWIREVIQLVRSLQTKNLPLIWVGTGTASEELLVDSGVDDFIAAADDAATIALRLRLRVREASARSSSDSQIKEQAANLSRMETMLKQREEFLSVCAHDLRSPLGLIQSSLTIALQDNKHLTPVQEELLTRAKRQAGHGLQLVADLLDVMSFEQGFRPRYQMLNLHELLGVFYKDCKFQAEQKQVMLHYDNLIPQWRVLGDADRVRQLLQNLITNALKFTETGKNIFLTVSPFTGRRKADPPYPMIIISVKDEGRGIPEAEMRKIFDRFTQIKKYKSGDGRGLGLTVAKQITTLHDGNIWVQSVEGKGSTFFALFPHAISRLVSGDSGGQRILVAEPNTGKRDKYYERLTAWGYEVSFAKDGVEAIALLYHLWPSAVILTGELPKLSAADVSNLIKSDPIGGKIPLIYAHEEKAPAEEENLLVDATVSLPFTRKSWDKAQTAIQQRSVSSLPPMKKVG